MTGITTANYSKFSLCLLLWHGSNSESRGLQHNLPVAASKDLHFDKQTKKEFISNYWCSHIQRNKVVLNFTNIYIGKIRKNRIQKDPHSIGLIGPMENHIFSQCGCSRTNSG